MHTPFARSAMNAIENIAAGAFCKSAAATFCLVLLVGCSALPTPPNRPVSYDFGPGLTSLPSINRAADETGRAVRQMGLAASAVSDNPQLFIYGSGRLPPGPGEPGFAPPLAQP